MVGAATEWWTLIYNRFMWFIVLIPYFALSGCGDDEAELAAAAEAKAKEDARVAEKAKKTVGDANVTSVYAREDDDESWTFHVTVEHKDVNWYDYADGWDVVLPDGTVVKPDKFAMFTRSLRHPHVDEQPFTRTQKGLQFPEGTGSVTVRAHDKAGGWGGAEITVDLLQHFGENFSVKRKL
jgi:hypothetical protein